MSALYSVPSQFSEKKIPINDFFINETFKRMGSHYTCVAGYDYTNGAFRSDNYRDILLVISGVDMGVTVTHKDCRRIGEKIGEIIADVKSKRWLAHYYHKFPHNRHNFPIEIYNHVDKPADKPVLNLFVSSCELEFLQTLFRVCDEYQLYLIPEYR